MPELDAFCISGLKLMFYSNDHSPPHFHAEKIGQWNIRIYIETTTEEQLAFDVKWPKKSKSTSIPPSDVRKELARLVVANRDVLMAEWSARVVS